MSSYGWQANRRVHRSAKREGGLASHAKVAAPKLAERAKAGAHPPESLSARTHERHHGHASGRLEPCRARRHNACGHCGIDLAGLARAALAAFVDDRMVDLSYPLTADARVRIVTPTSPEALSLYRHSTAHLLAAAVTNLFPGTQCGIGPATDEGFFYDFVVQRPFVPEDLDAIEKKMKEWPPRIFPTSARWSRGTKPGRSSRPGLNR